MGCGWYRQAYYPPEALIDRRSVEDLADELVREAEEGITVDDIDAPVKPGIIGEIGTDKPWLSAQEERSIERSPGRRAGPAWRSRRMP
jgi:phosphotriesterase-related protein